MKRTIALLALACVAACASEQIPTAVPPNKPLGYELGSGGIAWLPGRAPTDGAVLDALPNGQDNKLLTWHGGSVMTSTVTYAIFWGPKWSNSAFVNDKVSGMQSLLSGLNNTPYLNILSEYGASPTTAYIGPPLYDTNTADPSPMANNALIPEVCAVLNSHSITPRTDAIYFVFSDTAQAQGYGGYHSYGTCNGTMIHAALIVNLDSGSGGGVGRAGDIVSDGIYHSDSTAALAEVLSHEMAETITDPEMSTYYSSSGYEVGDECNWKMDGFEPLSNGDHFKLQLMWSNNATGIGESNGHSPTPSYSCVRGRYLPGSTTTTISGASHMGPGNMCSYTASASGGTAPYTYAFGWSGGSAAGYSPSNGSFQLVAESSSTYTINLSVAFTDANMYVGGGSKDVAVSTMTSYCY